MDQRLTTSVLIAAGAGSGIVGGVFFAFSSFVMPALARLAPQQGMQAMQAINATVLSSAFIKLFLLTALVDAVLLAAPLARGPTMPMRLAFAAGPVGLLGSFGVTMMVNVPLSERLAVPSADVTLWSVYLVRWTWWNSVRTVAAILSSVLAVTALLSLRLCGISQ